MQRAIAFIEPVFQQVSRPLEASDGGTGKISTGAWMDGWDGMGWR